MFSCLHRAIFSLETLKVATKAVLECFAIENTGRYFVIISFYARKAATEAVLECFKVENTGFFIVS